MSESKTMKVGISCGDLNGIGLEVVLKAFEDNRMHQDITPVLYCGVKVVSFHRKTLKLEDVQFHGVKSVNDIVPRKFNVVDLWEDEVPIEFGKPSGQQSKYAIQSLEAAAQDLGQGKIDMLVTAPIDKHSMQAAGFEFPGHTEYLSHLAGSDSPVLMILAADGLRVALVTGHLPINQVAEAVTVERIMTKARLFHRSLQSDFGINTPRIALLGLNPHAGDGGAIGNEDKERIAPAVRKLQEEGINAMGPYPADGFFGNGSYKHFDGVLAMYHDQGLAPFKALSFGQGVNYTAGLPIVRTSPVHGTGMDIAGKGEADESSFRHAIWLGLDIIQNRERWKRNGANPLQPQKKEKGGE